MARIVWNKRAKKNFTEIQLYLEKEFGVQSVKKFTKQFFDFLDILEKYPEVGIIENSESNIRGFVLHKYTTVFYRLVNNKIYLLAIFDNRRMRRKR